MDEPPDPHSLSKEQISARLKALTVREQQISDIRRGLHAEIDALRRELVARLRQEGGTIIEGNEGETDET